ncbi:hypothetical protein N1851_030221 [Merluccius polli]|uniref:HECT domain-containing protein n=1 Tax=Merluccius polli TaxID=89951 RepID=A0AA47M628_MERPO|nr:hypothetical protein N1851_030221 [Merluccius polli]
MSDQDLSKYIPHYGDRLAAVAFCRNSYNPTPGTSRRSQLLERIRANVCAPDSKAVKRAENLEKLKGNKHAKRKVRRVEIGWMNVREKDNDFKQVRTVKGGGTRHVSVDRYTTVREIQEMAESLFFPNGLYKSLKLEDHVRGIRDFSQNKIDQDCTVEDLYEKNKVKMLRLYLYTKRHTQDQGNSTDTHQLTTSEVTGNVAQNFNQVQASEPEVMLSAHTRDEGNEQGIYVVETEDQGNLETQFTRIEQGQEDQGAGVTFVIPEAQDVEMLRNTSTDGEVTVGASLSDSFEMDDTLPWEGSKPKVIIVVRRGNCLADLLAAFIDPNITNKDVYIKRKLPNGKLEDGEGSGVFRDCLSEFWGEFYSKCTLGTDVKTPYLRHEYQVQEWQAIARILVTGWTTVRYFPLLLPLPFLEEALYGTSYSSVTDSFLQYVSKEERKILELALESFESVDKDDLMDVLDAHDCHYLASGDTIAGLVSQLGHKTLVQTPMFVIECWKPILKTLADTLYPQRLVEIMNERVPTPKRVKELLKFPEQMTALQNTVARHLKRYIGESDNIMLRSFLRFCTGAGILFGHHITVQFIETSEFQCRPQAHTCGCYLMLPINYQNYPDLRNDFDLVLRSSIWVMDII